MPDLIREALKGRGMMGARPAHPPDQHNDHIGSLCVTRAKLEATQQKRLDQMPDELECGGAIIKMKWNPKSLPSLAAPV